MTMTTTMQPTEDQLFDQWQAAQANLDHAITAKHEVYANPRSTEAMRDAAYETVATLTHRADTLRNRWLIAYDAEQDASA